MRIEKLDARRTLKPLQKKRVAIYARVSSDKLLAEESLENQVQSFTEQINANPEWELAGTYVDCGISGTAVARPEFQRMLADCRNGKIDVILTKSFSRFARNTLVLLETLRELKGFGIEVIFEKDNIRSLTESGELLITLLAAFAQAESQSASENQRWRIKKMFEEGKPNTGKMLGYRLKDGKLEIVPEEAEIVRQIFNDYLSGMGLIAIAKKLNRMQIRTIKGGTWYYNSVRKVLTNEKYAGSLLLQKTYSVDYLHRKKLINHGERTRYFVENSHEAIVPQNVFDAVQVELCRRAEKAASKKENEKDTVYPFTGIVICGKCDKHYRRKITGAGSRYEKPVWICSTFNTIGREHCDSQQIPESILMAKTAQVLGTDDLDAAIPELLAAIRIPGPGQLVYVFKDGSEQEVVWENPSRSKSWTPEMRQKARERTLERNRKEDNHA